MKTEIITNEIERAAEIIRQGGLVAVPRKPYTDLRQTLMTFLPSLKFFLPKVARRITR